MHIKIKTIQLSSDATLLDNWIVLSLLQIKMEYR